MNQHQEQNEKIKKKSYIINNEQFELLAPGYPKGSDLTIINTSYVPRFKTEDGKVEKDYIAITFRDNKTGGKLVHIIYEPYYTFYMINDNVNVPEYNLFFIEKEYVHPVTCKYADLLRAIAEVTGREEEYIDNVRSGNSKDNKKLHTDTRIFMSDMNIENYYRFLFSRSYTNNTFKLRKGFMDIETDIRYSSGEFPEPGEVPINAIAYCDESNNTVYQFLYNDKNNPLVEKYMKECTSTDIETQIRDFVINAVGGYKKAVKFGVDKLKYVLVFFDSEIDLIQKMFKLVNTTVPDFIEFWNMAFDFNYIINRIQVLGYDPLDIICDPRIKQQFLKFYIDERNKNNYEERGDFVAASTYTVWIDQMIEFASRRKGRGRYQSFKLDAIGEVVAGVKKLDYSHITNNIGDLPYIDFKTFSFYNVMDVIVQKCIETNTQDLEYVFTKCLVNNTNYAKCHRQSVYLANRFSKDFFEYGYIIGNNKNLWNEKPSTKFPGAMVGNPLHNSPTVMVKVNGRATSISDNAVDFDYSSLYPSIILEFNLAPNTQIGRIIIEDKNDPNRSFGLNEHPDMYSSDDNTAKYSRGGEFLENYMCNSPIEFGRRWMGLGDVFDVINDLIEFFKYNGINGVPIGIKFNDSVYFVNTNATNAISIEDSYVGSSPVLFDNPLNDALKTKIIDEVTKGALL